MRIGPPAKRPMIFSFRFFDRKIVDRCVSKAHQAIVAKLPILVAIGAKPISRVVVPLVGEPHRNTISSVSPQLFDEPIVQLLRPFTFQKLNDFLPSTRKLGAISPARVDGVSECYLFRIAKIPRIFSEADLLNGGLTIKWRERRTGRDVSLRCAFAIC